MEEANNSFLLSWIIERLNILGYAQSSWVAETGNAVIADFVGGLGPKTMSVLKTPNGIEFFHDPLNKYVKQEGLRAYFIRNSSVMLSRENISKEIQYGAVGGKGLSLVTFERLMKGLVEKQVASNNELTGHFHRCMATLTDTVHFSDGRTVLYCPTFEFNSVAEAAQDKERLQIMESIVIHWTRQIKDVVNNHDSSASAETSGPLDEIEFWKGRAQDLIGIQKQLEGDKVCRLIEVLQYAKSNYIGPFQTLTKQIVDRAAESNENLKFLESIRSQCTALRQIEPEKIVDILPDLLNRIRLIWSLSSFYSDNENVSGILRKISNEIIRR